MSPEVQSQEAEIRRAMNRMRGRLAGFIEACGLEPRQERGIVSTMKDLSYETEKEIISAVNGN